MKKKWMILIDAIISIALILIILYFMDLNKLAKTLYSTNIVYLLFSIFSLLVMYGIMIYRINLVLIETKTKIDLIQIAKSHWVGMLVADFTPARSGYFATAGMLHYNYKVQPEKALVAIFGPQIFDFALKVTAGTIGIIFIVWGLLGGKNPIMLLGSGIMIIMIAIMLLLLFSKRFLNLFSFSKKLPLLNKIYRVIEKMQKNSSIIVNKTPELVVLLLLSWTAKAISWYFVAKAVGITVGFPVNEIFFYFFFQPMVTMLEFIPLPIIAGAGLSEAAGVFIMLLMGIPKEVSFSFMLLARAKTILVNLVALPEALKLTQNVLKKLL